MSRSASAVLGEMLAELPPGSALPRDPDSATGAFLTPLATELAELERRWAGLLNQTSPAYATDLLTDYERVLGPDPCRRDLGQLGTPQRQAIAELRWSSNADPTPALLVAIAAQQGIAVTVEEFLPDTCGRGECGDWEIGPETEAYGIIVHAPTATLVEDECGAGECGARINDFTSPLDECALRLWVPQHICLRVAYDGDA